jgi:hypothetical protein
MIFLGDTVSPHRPSTGELYDRLALPVVRWLRTESRGLLNLEITPIHKWYSSPYGSLSYEKDWGKDVFLDTDSGINAAIRKIRQVLKDDPEKPLFVQTITGKGYRFVAPMAEARASVVGQRSSTVKADVVGSGLVNAGNRDLAETTIGAKAGAPSSIGKRWRVIVPAAVAGLALSVGGYVYFHRAPKLTDKDTIVLADFTNTTGDSVFDGTLRQGLAVQLEQSPFLSLISEERIQQVLRLMDKPVDARLTPETAREICVRNVLRVGDHDLQRPFQNRVDRLPIHSCALHRQVGTAR